MNQPYHHHKPHHPFPKPSPNHLLSRVLARCSSRFPATRLNTAILDDILRSSHHHYYVLLFFYLLLLLLLLKHVPFRWLLRSPSFSTLPVVSTQRQKRTLYGLILAMLRLRSQVFPVAGSILVHAPPKRHTASNI